MENAKTEDGRLNLLQAFTEEDILEYKKAFAYSDKNSDGCISHKELINVMRSLGENPTENEILTLVLTMDADMNGLIEFEQFMMMMAGRKKEQDLKLLREAFAVFDSDYDGFISANELRSAILNLGDSFSEKEAEEMMALADTNKDGRIDFNEFSRMIVGELGGDIQLPHG